MAAGQGFQRVKVHQDHLGLPEGAHDVFGLPQVNGGLAADGGVHLGQRGGGAVDKVNAAHIGGGAETAQIPDDAAAHRNQQVLAGHIEVQHGLLHLAEHLEALAALALGHRVHHAVGALGQHRLGVLGGHAGIGENKHLAVGKVDELIKVGKAPPLHDDIIAAVSELHCQFHKESSHTNIDFKGRTRRECAPCGRRRPAFRSGPPGRCPRGRSAGHKSNTQTGHGAAGGS